MSHKLESRASYEAGPRAFFHRQLLEKPVPVPAGTTLKDQTAVVTGANAGLGLECSRQLLGLGLSRLVLACRSEARGNEAADQLRAAFPAATVLVWPLDMLSYESICAFVRKCSDELPRLDIALLNAGMQNMSFKKAESTGHEETFQVNYLSTALLSLLLLPVLKAKAANIHPPSSKPPILCIVTSDTSYMVNMVANDKATVASHFDEPSNYGRGTYGKSKLCVNWFVAQLAAEVDPDKVLVNMVNPGMTAGTGLLRDISNPIIRTIFGLVNKPLGRKVEVGAATYVDAAVVKSKESHGSFVSDWTIKP